jgi:hypothetical protein
MPQVLLQSIECDSFIGGYFMALRAKLGELKRMAAPIFNVAIVIALCVAAVWLLPAITAALLLGVIAAIFLHQFVIAHLKYNTRLAIFWAGMGVTADAAYAKLNDRAPVTVVKALAKVVEGAVKLADGLIKAVNLPVMNVRAKVAAFTPDFLWALIVMLLALMLYNMMKKR